MIEAQEYPNEGREAGARADFVASLGRRLSALRAGLREVESEPRSAARRDMLLRRIHALGAAAGVLGFDEVQSALGSAERALRRGGAEVTTGDIAEVARAFELVPSLVWGAKLGSEGAGEAAPFEPDHAWPLCVLVVGAASLSDGLTTREDGIAIEHELADEPARAVEVARTIAPDVVVVDADRTSSAEVVDELLGDPLIEPFALVVVGSFEQPEAASAFVAKGASRVLPKPVSPDTLRRNIASVGRRGGDALTPREPVGDVTVDELAARIGAEVRRGLVEATENPGRNVSIPFGEGVDVLAAVWGAVARVREIATMRSGGGVRFEATGPEGAIPLAPWTGGDRRAGERGMAAARLGDGVRLEGRRAVVVDDDPSIVWFLSGLLRGAGVEVLEAHDGAQALELVVTTWPDVVVSDVLMPKMDGFSLCREIKRDIAVRDVPVILLSWKEDLLQRVRELGAGADGYLRKEATGATVLERIREVLRPRARVESRLAGDGGVRGRLDGLTPRLILELACAHRGDCRVSVRDAVFLYEVEIRGGKPVQATRTASDGSFERGARVVAGLLGVSAGRFVITPNSAPSRDDFKSSLDDLLAGPVRRARSAQRLLSGKALLSVETVDIDEAAVAAYVASTPDPAHSLTQRLIAGESPRDIVLSGEASAEMVELVLTDVARHGGVRAVVRDGAPIDLDAAPPAHVVPRVSQPDVAVSDTQDVSEPPQFTFQLSPEPPAADSHAEAPVIEQPSARLPMSRQVTPPIPTEEQLDAAGFREERTTFPGVGPESGKAPAVIVEESEPPMDLGAAVIGAETDERDATKSPPAATVRAVSPLPTIKSVVRPPRPEPDSVDEAWGDAGGAGEPSAEPWRPLSVEIAPDEDDDEPVRDEAEESDEDDDEPVRDEAEESAEDDDEPVRDEAEESAEDEDEDEDEPAHDEDDDEPAQDEADDESDEDEDVAAALPLPAKKRIEFPRDLPAKKRIEFPREASSASPAPPEPEPREDVHVARRDKKDGGVLGIARVVLVMGAAGALSFAAVSWLRSMSGSSEQQPAAAASAPAAGAAAMPTVAPTATAGSAPAKPKAGEPQAKIEALPLPPGVPLADDKGLLEIDIAGKDAIYVDGTFVGRGPLRRVPLDPGKHDVKLRQPGEERTFQVDVKKGSRTRLSLAAAAE